MGELLLELLSEEIPARMQRRAIDDLVRLIRDKLAAAEIPAAAITGYVTPRRLAVIADGIPEGQPERKEERRGPRVGAPQQALDGFLRAAGVASIEQCEVRDTGRGEFYFAVIERPGRPAAEVLPELLRAAIDELPWPKSMRFPAASFRWVRPLSSVICLSDGQILPLKLDDVPVGRTTRGHRFLSEGEIAVDNVTDYRAKLEAAHVILDQDRRRAVIEAGLAEKAAAEGLRVKDDQGLLDEVTGLVEYPVVLMGAIDDASMELPPEVLATAMRTHQKYFSCLKADGTPAPRFLFVANNRTPDDGKTIVAGNERVLRARLSDARFFWDQDRKIPLADRVEALKGRVYYAGLGSVYEKTQRLKIISSQLASFLQLHIRLGIGPADAQKLADAAATLCKADLSTGMVGEFPELQGIIGRYYAIHDKLNSAIADAVADHYKPVGAGDTCPTAPLSFVMALADKLEALVGFFAIDERPTGSRDPFALRRAALGIIRLIRENNLRLPLRQTIDYASSAFSQTNFGLRDIKPALVPFIEDRVKVYLRDHGVRHDLVAAVFALNEDDLVRLLKRVDALTVFLNTEDGANLVVAYRRASNILTIEERRDNRTYNDFPRSELLQFSAETNLHLSLEQAAMEASGFISRELFEDAMAALATLRRPVDEFFDKVTVNAPEPELRENRLRLLSRIRNVMNQVADFSQIEG